MAEPTNQPAQRRSASLLTRHMIFWAEQSRDNPCPACDPGEEGREVWGEIVVSLRALEARLVAAETQQKQTIEHLRQLAHEFDKERRGLSVSGRINDLADALAVLAASRQEPRQ